MIKMPVGPFAKKDILQTLSCGLIKRPLSPNGLELLDLNEVMAQGNQAVENENFTTPVSETASKQRL